jgi:protein-S-isoprenylcysteine O-methyltransferase Ste14
VGVKMLFGKIAYATTFVVVAPALLWWWAHASADAVMVPALRLPLAGILVSMLGILLMTVGMLDLWRYGGGLPMNAFPPPNHVSRGIYALIPHPIYVGFTCSGLGWSLWAGSASGLWLVTPCTALALWALVQGYERKDLARRFGVMTPPWLALPPDERVPVGLGKRIAAALLVFSPWLLSYEAVHALGRPPDAFDLYLTGERTHAVWQWTEWIYASDYLVPRSCWSREPPATCDGSPCRG